MGRFAAGAAASGSLHAGQRLAKPGLSGLSSNSSEQTTQTLMGSAIGIHFNRCNSHREETETEEGG
jgi:hypothetical protein